MTWSVVRVFWCYECRAVSALLLMAHSWLAVKFELSLFALEAPKPAIEGTQVVRSDLAGFEGLARRNEPVLSNSPAGPRTDEIVAAVDLILQYLGDLQQCDGLPRWCGELL